MSPATSLSVIGLSKAFGETPVLAGLDLEVPAGSLTAVLGPSGCGKTTLLRLLGGFERADGGSIRLGAQVLCDERTHLAPERREIGFVPQEGALFPHLDVAANVGFGLPRAERRGGRVEELLELVDLEGLGEAACPTSSPAASSSASPSPGRWPRSRGWSCSTSPSTPSTPACARRCAARSARPCARPAPPRCSSPTTRRRRSRSPTRVAVMRGGRIVQAADPQTLYRDPVDAEVAGLRRRGGAARGPAGGRRGPRPRSATCARAGPRSTPAAAATVMLRPEQILCRGRRTGAQARTAESSRPPSTATTRPPGSPSRRAVARSSRGPPATCCRRSASGSRSRSTARRWPTPPRAARASPRSLGCPTPGAPPRSPRAALRVH